ncbi:cytidylyltransferase domain-containing protein [Pseudoalteromonas rubra]|uniref:acylneuraminate cytidylyltransferase family protein n=1 Tax=Pseudoalteromonas rubra TaxID=43658 RepID=UPI000F7B7B80|nr:acylneuraminate cytidylyltransferase family protein [Pseudoalteromonas rubra]
MAKIFAVTFARAGSKGIIKKNIKPLNGKPLLAYSIELAHHLSQVEGVYVSTDGDDIAQVATTYGAQVITRPEALASDQANEWLAWQHAVEYLQAHCNMQDDDLFLSLPCTAPLRAREDIERLVSQFNESTCDLALCVTESARNPYFNMVHLDDDGLTSLVCDAGQFHRRQDVPSVYDVTTVGYLTTARFILTATGVLSGSTLGVVIPRSHSIDIDDQLDFEFAELLIKKREQA